MGWLIVAIVVLIIGIILAKTDEYCSSRFDIGVELSTTASIAIIIFAVVLIYTQVTLEKNYKEAEYEKQVLEYRLETDLNGNELLYSDVTEWNEELYRTKHWNSKFMTRGFVNRKIAENIDYIEIGGLRPGENE